jgi:hypothetical protein
MTNGEQIGNSEQEPQISFMDYLRAEQQKVIEAQEEAKLARQRADDAGKNFQAELNKLRGKKIIFSGSLTGETYMTQDSYEMDRSYRSVTDLKANIGSVWAKDDASEGYNRNIPIVFMKEKIPGHGYSRYDIRANLFELSKVEIIDEPEVPTEAAKKLAAKAVKNTLAKS